MISAGRIVAFMLAEPLALLTTIGMLLPLEERPGMLGPSNERTVSELLKPNAVEAMATPPTVTVLSDAGCMKFVPFTVNRIPTRIGLLAPTMEVMVTVGWGTVS